MSLSEILELEHQDCDDACSKRNREFDKVGAIQEEIAEILGEDEKQPKNGAPSDHPIRIGIKVRNQLRAELRKRAKEKGYL